MITIRRGATGRIAILCEDIRGGVPHQRLVEAWGKYGIDIYPLATTSLEYIDGDFICCGRFGSLRWNTLSQLLGLSIIDRQKVLPGTYIIEEATAKGRHILLGLGQDLPGLLYALEDLSLRTVFSPEGLTY